MHDERFWNPLPMFHMGQVFPLLAHMHVGATVVTSTHFDAAEALHLIEAERITFAYPTFPVITQDLIRHPDFERTDLGTIRLVNDTGPPETLREVQARFAPAPVVTLFGMTETCGGVSWSAPGDPYEKRMTTGGLPLRGVDVRIVDPETDEEMPAGERGEITVRSPGLFERYHNDPEKTAHAMRGGWFHTGDLGRVDEDGRLTFLGRLKDMLKVGGENVAALEIEAYLATHPAVKIAQVVGVPDRATTRCPPRSSSSPKMATSSEEELIEFCRGRIARFKIPRYVRFVSLYLTSRLTLWTLPQQYSRKKDSICISISLKSFDMAPGSSTRSLNDYHSHLQNKKSALIAYPPDSCTWRTLLPKGRPGSASSPRGQQSTPRDSNSARRRARCRTAPAKCRLLPNGGILQYVPRQLARADGYRTSSRAAVAMPSAVRPKWSSRNSVLPVGAKPGIAEDAHRHGRCCTTSSATAAPRPPRRWPPRR